MVQTYQSPVRVYKYPFELVMAAYDKRFPTCPMIPVFVGSETLSEETSPDGAEFAVQRKCKLNVDAPYLLKKVAGIDFVYFMQTNTLNKRKRVLAIEAYNITFASRINIVENCLYYVHPENPEWTCFEQSASLDVKSFFGFEATVEKIAMRQYSQNIQKGKEIIEYYVAEILAEGTFVCNYSESFDDPNAQSPSLDSAISDVVSRLDDLTGGRRHSKARRQYSADDSGAESSDQHVAHGYSEVKFRSRAGTIVKQPLKQQPSDETADSKLETEYIHRFLGDLSILEESRLCELRNSLQQTHKGKVPNDAHMLRFLRARQFDVQRAREMLVASIIWRKQHNVDKILSVYEPPPVLMQYFPGCWHHHDLEGRPLFVLRLGLMDLKGLLKSTSEDALVKFVLSICEQGLKKCEEATMQFGKPISSWTLLVDVEDASTRLLWRPGITALLRIIEIAEANYPETMGLALIVRTPRVFPVVWTLVSSLINEDTRRKFLVFSSNDCTLDGGLSKYIALEYIPDFLSGPSQCLAPSGGLVPKTLYVQPVLDEDEDATAAGCSGSREKSPSFVNSQDVLESLYQKGHVYKGLPHEVLVPVNDAGSVLTWDFDIVRGECEFIILRTHRIINTEDICLPSPGALSVLTVGTATPVSFDKTLELGLDLFIENRVLVCKEGDSVQGSHFCGVSGTYVLQWRSVDANVHAHSFDLSLHKCKVMYYYELLKSADLKGSVASLESCRSSFSSLSVGAVSAVSRNSSTEVGAAVSPSDAVHEKAQGSKTVTKNEPEISISGGTSV